MQKILQIILDNWEKCVLGLAIAIGILLCAVAAFFFQGELQEPPAAGKPLPPVRYFPWDDRPQSFLNPTIPAANDANPFAKALTSTLPKPQPAEPPKKVEPPPEPPKPAPPPEPPKPPKVMHKITVMYRGYYTDLAGNTLCMIAIEDTRQKGPQFLRVKRNESFLDFFTLANITENDITVQTRDGQLKSIPWTQSATFELNQAE